MLYFLYSSIVDLTENHKMRKTSSESITITFSDRLFHHRRQVFRWKKRNYCPLTSSKFRFSEPTKKQSEDTKLWDRETLEFIHELSSWLSAGLIGGGQFELHTRRRARNYPRLIENTSEIVVRPQTLSSISFPTQTSLLIKLDIFPTIPPRKQKF
jgi:hypothetical protein